MSANRTTAAQLQICHSPVKGKHFFFSVAELCKFHKSQCTEGLVTLQLQSCAEPQQIISCWRPANTLALWLSSRRSTTQPRSLEFNHLELSLKRLSKCILDCPVRKRCTLSCLFKNSNNIPFIIVHASQDCLLSEGIILQLFLRCSAAVLLVGTMTCSFPCKHATLFSCCSPSWLAGCSLLVLHFTSGAPFPCLSASGQERVDGLDVWMSTQWAAWWQTSPC